MSALTKKVILERVQKGIEQMPYLRWLGIRIRNVRRGRVLIEMPIRDEMLQVAGLLHGGVVASLVDVACALATMSALPRFHEIRTLEMKVNFFKPVRGGLIQTMADCIHVGKRTAVTVARVREKTQRIKTAYGITTFAIIQNDKPSAYLERLIQ